MSKVNFSINRLLHFAHNITSRKCKVVAIYYSFLKNHIFLEIDIFSVSNMENMSWI